MDEREEKSWPPPIEHPPSSVRQDIGPSQQRTLKRRWYYSLMAALFVWMFYLEWNKFGGPVLNFDTLTGWIGVPLFCWRAVEAWALYLRVRR